MCKRRAYISTLLVLLLLLPTACTKSSGSISSGAPRASVPLHPDPQQKLAPGDVSNGMPATDGDFRSKDLSRANLLKEPDRVWTLTFDTSTLWPKKLPEDFDPGQVLAWGEDPGLGVNQLHQQGITGKGVNVAYVDQPLLLGHEGLKGINLTYTKVRLTAGQGDTASMHGPAVASLLAGPEIGVAPDVHLFYYAHPSWLQDQTTHADALHAVIAQNQSLPAGQKIRVVGFSDGPDTHEKNIEAYQTAIKDAESAGILVVDVSHPFTIHPATIPPFKDKNDPANWKMAAWLAGPPSSGLFVPTGGRTTAVGYPERTDAYAYWTGGGLSWAVPYVVGTLALGWQVDPNLTNANAVKYLTDSSTSFPGGKLINPGGFVELVRQNKK